MNLRDNNIERISNKTFDVLIIGGGINGAAAATALAARGAKVALVDKGDFAGSTSQNSSNLVWGGIKYMETYEFPLVRQLCMSRNHLVLTLRPSGRSDFLPIWTKDSVFHHFCFIAEPCFIGQ